eukprot:COSAG06_NODE_40245_length_403_cov_3.338816_1_plen_87_part_10
MEAQLFQAKMTEIDPSPDSATIIPETDLAVLYTAAGDPEEAMEPCCARAAASSLTVLLPMLAVGGRCARRSLLAARVRAAADSRAVP